MFSQFFLFKGLSIYYIIRGSGFPRVLQDYVGGGWGGGISLDPKFLLRKMWRAPNSNENVNDDDDAMKIMMICHLGN